MESIKIRTAAGELELAPAAPDYVKRVASRWPMGMIFSNIQTEPNGLIFQVGEEEAYGVKVQPPDTNEENAQALFFLNQTLITAAIPFYLQKQNEGLMLPCAYIKRKGGGYLFESGLAFFVNPRSTTSRSSAGFFKRLFSSPPAGSSESFDPLLGQGASKMVFDMVGAIAKAAKSLDLPLNTAIGIEVRPRLSLAQLGLTFIVHNTSVTAIQHPLNQDHPIWACAVRSGFSSLPYAPMIPGAVPALPNRLTGWLDRVNALNAHT